MGTTVAMALETGASKQHIRIKCPRPGPPPIPRRHPPQDGLTRTQREALLSAQIEEANARAQMEMEIAASYRAAEIKRAIKKSYEAALSTPKKYKHKPPGVRVVEGFDGEVYTYPPTTEVRSRYRVGAKYGPSIIERPA